jgi:hypothetical protein
MLLKPKLIIANIRYSFPGAEIVYLNNPYGFYEIMRSIFPDAAPWMYEEDIVVKIKNRFFNISGEVKGNFTPMTQERINFLKKTRNDRIYNRSVTPVPAESGRKKQEQIDPPNVVAVGYYYGGKHSPSYEDERKRLAKFFGRKSSPRKKR